MKTITLKTLQKIQRIFEDEKRPLSKNYIATQYKINYQAVKIAIQELLNKEFLKRINTPYAELYSLSKEKIL